MRVRAVSDLHLECHSPAEIARIIEDISDDADLLVLAGDIAQVSRFQRRELTSIFTRLRAKARKVVFVPGNHAHYRSDPAITEQRLDAVCAASGVEFLKTGRVLTLKGKVFGDCRVLGGTMWFEDDPTTTRSHKMQLNDFHHIKDFEPWVYQQCEEFKVWLQTDLREGDIVVTHHLPSQKSVHPRYRGDDLNRFFVCDMEPLIIERKPALWVHGHSHSACQYEIGEPGRGTLVVCNPMGYPGEGHAGYDPGLVVDV